jgi:hypothetical protein
VAAGFDPAAFWNETPRSFVTIMEGAGRAAERKFDRELLVAHQGAAWVGAAYAGKLKPFKHYRPEKTREQSPGDMIGTLMALQDMGAPMTIEQIN